MSDTHVELPGSNRPPPLNGVRVRDVDPHTQVNITVTLKTAEAAKIEVPTMALSRAEIDKQLNVKPEQVRKVKEVLRSFGLHERGDRQGGLSLRFSGTVAAMTAAFGAKFGIYNVPGQGEIRAREGTLMVPKDLAGIVGAVLGLDQRRMARRHSLSAATVRAATMQPLQIADLEKLYDFPAGDGAGMRIAIAEFGQELGNGQALPPAYIPSDVTQFCDSQHVAVPKITPHSIGTSPLTQQQYESYMQQLPLQLRDLLFSQTAETMMDVQIIAGLCPKADLDVYFATWGEAGWVDLLDEVTAGGAATPIAVSISYGLAEEASDWSQGAMAAINKRLSIAASMGITVCVSSGDDGTGCGQPDKRCHVEFPSSSPFVLSVGGTMLSANGNTFDEVVWWESPGQRTPKGGGATGAGVSALNSRPPWQTVNVPSLNPGAPKGRVVPDVAALAGPPLYYLLLDGKPLPDGGTSAATPLWASLIARIAAKLPAAKQRRFLPQLLYQQVVSSVSFRDILQGNNASHPNPGIGYQAKAGFDAVSGWGVPKGNELLSALMKV